MNPQPGDVFSVVGDRYEFLVTGEQTGGALAMFSFLIQAGHGPPPHVHQREDEIFHVLAGEVLFTVDGQEMVLKAGETLHAMRGIPHTFTNKGPEAARMIVVVTPAGLENFFATIGRRLPSKEADPIDPTPEDIALLLATAPAYGLEILPPPPA
jgi:quercetin dioxygenase-like cupin family protein